jgi:hypothetical protein
MDPCTLGRLLCGSVAAGASSSLSNTETREQPPQDIVGRDGARHLAKSVERSAKRRGNKFWRLDGQHVVKRISRLLQQCNARHTKCEFMRVARGACTDGAGDGSAEFGNSNTSMGTSAYGARRVSCACSAKRIALGSNIDDQCVRTVDEWRFIQTSESIVTAFLARKNDVCTIDRIMSTRLHQNINIVNCIVKARCVHQDHFNATWQQTCVFNGIARSSAVCTFDHARVLQQRIEERTLTSVGCAGQYDARGPLR